VRTQRKNKSGKSKPEVLVLEMAQLEDIVKRALSGPISEADGAKLLSSLGSLAWLQQELANKDITLARLRSLFGLNTSEKKSDLLGETDSDGEPNNPPNDDNEKPKPKPKPKPKGHGRNAAADYTGAEHIEVPHESLKPSDPCPACPVNMQGKVYSMPPRTLVRVVGQAPLFARIYELQRLRCNLCGKIFTAEPPPGIGNEKYGATAASMIALLRYGSGMPFNRLQRLEGGLGVPLPAATQWKIVHEAAEQVAAVHDELIRQAAQGRLLHNDDTSMEVLALRKRIEQEQKSGQAKSDRTGIFLTNIVAELDDRHQIALFFTGRNHAGENMAALLARRAADLQPPIQMCDGLDRNLPGQNFETVLANCLVHGRRKFVELLGSFPKECRHVIEVLGNVYGHEATTRKQGMTDAERLRYHQEHSRPLLDELKIWMEEQTEQKLVEPNSSLGGAIAYMTKRWDRLTLFLSKPGAPLDNNINERALKKAILHRRNSLFYKTETGAWVGDVFMSLIHTAELARANPFDYLTALLRHTDAARRNPGQWMPWNYAAALADCKPSDSAGSASA
jgi:transposase